MAMLGSEIHESRHARTCAARMTDYRSNWTSGPSRIGLGTGPLVEKTMVPLLSVAKYRRVVTPTCAGLALAKYEVAGGGTESLQVSAGAPASVTLAAASFARAKT